MGFALSTLGADAEFGLLCAGRAADRLGTSTAPLAAATPSASATALAATAAGPAALIGSIHEIILLVYDIVAMKRTAASTAASGHPKGLALQPAPAPGLDHRSRRADHIGNDLDAIAGHHGQHRPRYGPADQGVGLQLHQPQGFLERKFAWQHFHFFVAPLPRDHVHQEDFPGDIENRGNALIPYADGDFHPTSFPEVFAIKNSMTCARNSFEGVKLFNSLLL
jgi:hypothetical protein